MTFFLLMSLIQGGCAIAVLFWFAVTERKYRANVKKEAFALGVRFGASIARRNRHLMLNEEELQATAFEEWTKVETVVNRQVNGQRKGELS